MMSVDELAALLAQAAREPLRRKELVKEFQRVVWDGLDSNVPLPVADLLRDLAYDLDFFEAKATVRQEDGSLYGHKRFEEEVLSALNRLRAAGVKI